MTTRVLVLAIAVLFLAALEAETEYRMPPRDVVRVVDAPATPSVDFSPDGLSLLIVERDEMPSIADVSRRMLRLAGTRIDPAANGRYSTSFDKGIVLRTMDGRETRIAVPADARLSSVSWCHDSELFAFTNVTDSGTELWVCRVADPVPWRLTDRLSTITGGIQWTPDGDAIIARLVPAGRGAEPAAPRVPTGPNIQESSGLRSPLRTYQDLLQNPHDVALFEHYATTRIARFDLTPGEREATTTLLGEPGIYTQTSPSPDGEHLLVTRIEQPYSYLMPYYSFPRAVEVWSRNGQREHTFATLPLAENVPIGGVETGPRSIAWKATEPDTLVWVEALDGGDPKNEVTHRDVWRESSFPFAGAPRDLVRVGNRAQGLTYLADPDHVITREFDRDRRWTRTLLHDLSRGNAAPKVLDDRSVRDRYGNPGRLEMELNEYGEAIVKQDGPWVYRLGDGVTADGTFPFLARQNLETLETERLWQCEEGSYETVAKVLGEPGEGLKAITRHESPASPPNYRFLSVATGTAKPITSFPDPTPQLRNLHKELVIYERKDGVELSATLYLPSGYTKEDGPLPLLVWAYPREFSDRGTAGQVTANPWRFTRISGSSHLHLLSQGYAIMDGATMPIIGDAETMNDTFLEQLVDSAQAAIDKAVSLGVADRERVAVGGHSYGAFMTANLLAHCDLFAAGIARSGAYNRTLTPFGFQAERRTLWQAPEIYFKISPFMHASEIDEPILLIHGEMDNNSGTFPIQSRRLYQAIKGNGGTARLVMLPHESHGYRARESVLHVLAESIEWLDRHVKGRGILPAGFKEK